MSDQRLRGYVPIAKALKEWDERISASGLRISDVLAGKAVPGGKNVGVSKTTVERIRSGNVSVDRLSLENFFRIAGIEPALNDHYVQAQAASPLASNYFKLFAAIDHRWVTEHHAELIGRAWLYQEIEDRLTDKALRCIFVQGDEGTGKSAFLANWALNPTPHTVVARHFFRHNVQQSRRPRNFVCSLVRQILDAQVQGYAKAVRQSLDEYLQRGDIERVLESLDAHTLFEDLVVQPLSASSWGGQGLCILAIDALDEANSKESHPSNDGAEASINLHALYQSAKALPPWARLVVTTRPVAQLSGVLQSRATIDLSGAGQAQDLVDFLEYKINGRYGTEAFEEIPIRELAEQVAENIDGSFELATLMIADPISLANPHLRPREVAEYYQTFFARCKDFRRDFADLLGIHLAFGEPISDELVAEILGIDPDAVTQGLQQLSPLVLYQRDLGKRQIKHKTLSDWLVDTSEDHQYKIHPERYKTKSREWLEKAYMRPDLKTAFGGACVLSGVWRPEILSALLQVDQSSLDVPLTELSRLFVLEKSVCDSTGGEVGFTMPDLIRKQGLQFLERDGALPALVASRDSLFRQLLEERSKAQLQESLGSTVAHLDAFFADPMQLEKFFEFGPDDAYPLLTEILVRGKLNLIAKAALKFLVQDNAKHAQMVVVQGTYHYMRGNYDKARNRARQAEKLAKNSKESWLKCAARASFVLCDTFDSLRVPATPPKLDEEQLQRKATELDANLQACLAYVDGPATKNTTYWTGMAHMQIATAYWHLLRYSEEELGFEATNPLLQLAIDGYEQAVHYFRNVGDQIMRAYAFNSLGHLYRLAGNRDLSLSAYAAGLQISERTANERAQLGFAHGMAGWLAWTGENTRFQKLMAKVEGIYKAGGNEMIPAIRAEYDLLWANSGAEDEMIKRAQRPVKNLSREMKIVLKTAREEFAYLKLMGPRPLPWAVISYLPKDQQRKSASRPRSD